MSFPLVPLSSIAPSGLRAPVGDWARGAAGEGTGGEILSVEGEIELIRRGPHVLSRGQVVAVTRVPCGRCGELLEISVGGPFACVYSPLSELPTPGEEDEEPAPLIPSVFAGEAEEAGEYDGDAIDLRQVVRELLALELPARVLCADLVPEHDDACLARWKIRAGTVENPSLSPFAALKALKPS